jgi:hypothetical protein
VADSVSESPSFKKVLEDKLGLQSFGIGYLRDVEWGKKYLWAIRFTDPKPPKPFDTFFPATDVSIPEAQVNSFNFEQGQGSFRVPQRTDVREISLTFYDDSKGTLFNWFKNWIAIDILNDNEFISCIKDSHIPKRDPYHHGRVYPVRTMEIQKLNEGLEPIEGEVKVYTVYPEGTIEYSGSSGSEAHTYTITFTIVGEGSPAAEVAKEKDIKFYVNKGAQLLGRFF